MSERCPTCSRLGFRPKIFGLTNDEWLIANAIHAGRSYKEIASDLKVSLKRVRRLVERIHLAWSVKTKRDVALRVIELKKIG